MGDYFNLIKVIHIISMTTWMAGMFYLPRLFAYHADVKVGSEMDKTFKVMERRLLRVIMNPSMVIVTIMGLLLAHIYGFRNLGGWFYIKVALVLLLFAMHGFMAKCRRDFERGINTKSSRFYKIVNEAISVAFVLIVIMIVIKPFDD